MIRVFLFAVLCAAQVAIPGTALRAGEADVVAAQAVREGAGLWRPRRFVRGPVCGASM